ncbi:MAG: twin-arginine translocase subunit TatC [Dehalococcoidia bacterium]
MAVTAAPQPGDFEGGRPMTILEHLLELRMRLIWCCLALVIGIVVSALLTDEFLKFLKEPMARRAPNADLIFTSPLESFSSYFTVTLYGALAIGMPVFVYQTLMFVMPGLTPVEKRWVLPIVFGAFFSFGVGMAFAYYVILPPSLGFLLNFNAEVVKAQIRIGEYIGFVTRLVFFVGLSFEMPLVLMGLARFGLVTGRQVLGWWRYMIVVIFIIAALVTPTPDPLTQSLVAAPLFLLYWIGVLLAFIFGQERANVGRMLKRLPRRSRSG